jgi:hypothetical protein
MLTRKALGGGGGGGWGDVKPWGATWKVPALISGSSTSSINF